MNGSDEAGTFLRSRRGRITPRDAGIVSHGQRRVPGLRRGEVALLAGVSVEYYTRLERGGLRGVSDGILDAIARALRLDPVEHQYLHDLARAANAPAARPVPVSESAPVPPSLLRIIESMTDLPAFVINHRMDTLAANALGRALYTPMGDGRNAARWGFLDPAAKQFYIEWDLITRFTAGVLRANAARRPGDQLLSGLIDELSARSQDFRTAWAAQDVNLFRVEKRLRHPHIGVLDLQLEILAPPDGSDLSVVVYTPIPGTGAQDGLKLLASWAAQDPAPALTS